MTDTTEGLAQRFTRSLAAIRAAAGDDPVLLPTCVARAVSEAMPTVAGAGLTLADGEDQIPVGSSDREAALAEQVQFTVKDGPGWESSRIGLAIAADSGGIRRRWSLFADQLFARTRFRAVHSVLIPADPEHPLALDLWFDDERDSASVPFADVATLVELLVAGLRDTDDRGLLNSPPAVARTKVWVAVGIVMSRLALESADARDLLRAYCFAHDLVMDELAQRIVDHEFDVMTLTP